MAMKTLSGVSREGERRLEHSEVTLGSVGPVRTLLACVPLFRDNPSLGNKDIKRGSKMEWPKSDPGGLFPAKWPKPCSCYLKITPPPILPSYFPRGQMLGRRGGEVKERGRGKRSLGQKGPKTASSA